jgi:hypothetical protein
MRRLSGAAGYAALAIADFPKPTCNMSSPQQPSNLLRIAAWANGTPIAQTRCSHFATLQFRIK